MRTMADDVTYRTLFQVPVLATTTVGEEAQLNDFTMSSITFSILSKTLSLNAKYKCFYHHITIVRTCISVSLSQHIGMKDNYFTGVWCI